MQQLFRGIIVAALLVTTAAAETSPPVVVSAPAIGMLVAPLTHNTDIQWRPLAQNIDPHSLTVTPSMAQAISNADIFFWLNGTMEPLLVEHAQAAKMAVAVVTDTDFAAGHFWMDGAATLAIADSIAATLRAQFPHAAAQITANADALQTTIRAADADAQAQLRELPLRAISQHGAWTLFFARYLPNGDLLSLSTDAEAPLSGKTLRAAQQRAVDFDCFLGDGMHPRSARALAERLKLPAALLDTEALLATSYDQWLQDTTSKLLNCS